MTQLFVWTVVFLEAEIAVALGLPAPVSRALVMLAAVAVGAVAFGARLLSARGRSSRAAAALTLVAAALGTDVAWSAGWTWRATLMAAGALTLVAVVANNLRSGGPRVSPVPTRAAGVRRVLELATVRQAMKGYLALGIGAVPLLVYLASLLQQRAGAAPHTAMTIAALVVAPLVFGGAVALDRLLGSVVPAPLRSHAYGLADACSWGLGTVAGFALFASLDRRFGVGGALLSFLLPATWAAWAYRRATTSVDDDIAALAHAAADADEAEEQRGRGTLPLVACRGVDFSYGKLQVLFGVDFTVSEGELVALLGTNGAGKSTLLRTISGLALPDRGAVRFDGVDVTRLGAEQRVALGITQIAGGGATFGPLSVVDNLRLFAYTHRRQKRALADALDLAFETFPQLASRRNQLAQTLSGGEQHMLGLTKALILRPRLLLVDELSLGLAPKVVGQLLTLLREINGRGTAVVVVEQSVNVALSLADHACFMERGEIRFDGKSRDLLERRDLLRAVFLGGAAEGVRTRAKV